MKEELTKEGDGITCPIAVIVKNGMILTGHRHYTLEKWKTISVWTLPGGRSDEGETIEEALRREVSEEVGITDLEILDFIGEVAGAKEGDRVPIFYCVTKQNEKLMEPEKFSEWKWVSIQTYVDEEKYGGFNSLVRKKTVEYLMGLE